MKRAWASLAIGLAFLGLLGAPVTAGAGDLKIWMDAFKSDYLPLTGETTTLLVFQSPASVGLTPSASKTNWWGWAPVNLPVGTVITNVVYYHGGSNMGNFTGCRLLRVRLGRDAELVASAFSQASPSATITLLAGNPDKLVIMKGYRYFVQVFTEVSTSVRGVRIFYD